MSEPKKSFEEEVLQKLYNRTLLKQLNENTGINTRTNMYITEVTLVKELLAIFVGESVNSDPDYFHDFCCDIVDKIHKDFDK